MALVAAREAVKAAVVLVAVAGGASEGIFTDDAGNRSPIVNKYTFVVVRVLLCFLERGGKQVVRAHAFRTGSGRAQIDFVEVVTSNQPDSHGSQQEPIEIFIYLFHCNSDIIGLETKGYIKQVCP